MRFMLSMGLAVSSCGWLPTHPAMAGSRHRPQPVMLQPVSDADAATHEEHEAAAIVEKMLRIRSASQPLNKLVKDLPDLKAYLMSAPIRLLPLLQLFPERFFLEPAPHLDGVHVRLGSADASSPFSTDDVSVALADRLSARLLHYHATRDGTPTDPVPLRWLVRTMSAELELLIACGLPHEPTLLYHLHPECSGFSSRWAAWWASVDAHLQRFVQLQSERFVWHVAVVGESGGEPTSAISLTASAVQEHARQREQARSAQRKRRRQHAEGAGVMTAGARFEEAGSSEQPRPALAGSQP